MQWLVVNTLFQETMDHDNQEDVSRETQKLDPCWKSRLVARHLILIGLHSRFEKKTRPRHRIKKVCHKILITLGEPETRVQRNSTEENEINDSDELQGNCARRKTQTTCHKRQERGHRQCATCQATRTKRGPPQHAQPMRIKSRTPPNPTTSDQLKHNHPSEPLGVSPRASLEMLFKILHIFRHNA